ncbi:MAG: deoxyribonuclease IV [Gemmatimonadetes bacterium]|nr:deoxyribonuclease IV [Gemmatimonadota bacterium]
MEHRFGSHTVDTGGMDMAVRRARAAGLDAVQIFTAIPKFYNDKASIREDRVRRFQEALAETGIRAEDVMVHASYIVGGATPKPEQWERAAGGLAKEMERSTLLGVGGVCFHPGSSGGDALEATAQRVAKAMARALKGVDGSTKLWLENTAGAGTTFGRTPDELGAVLAHLPRALRSRTGYGLDTCHLFAAGHDISASPDALKEVLDAFEDAAGEPPAFFHLNDSEGELGSNLDRHRLLGEGRIGTEPFRWLLRDPRSRGVPLVLETPQKNAEPEPDDPAADPWDARMASLLRELADA